MDEESVKDVDAVRISSLPISYKSHVLNEGLLHDPTTINGISENSSGKGEESDERDDDVRISTE